jgi:DNA-binding CsgD family transcriptional regulator
VALLEPRVAAAGRGWRGDVLPVAPELVQAYLTLGRADEATDLAHRYAAANPPPAGPVIDAYVARTLASVEPDLNAACGHFEAALAALATLPDPFEQAQTRLMYGARLRRAGHRIAARAHLRAARDAFAAADLTLWARRAADELGATGETARARRQTTDEPLTSQESRVALLVARGLTNKEVAAALFLSPKTVEHHLGNVYRKRGLRSRSQLTRAFAANPDPNDDAPATRPNTVGTYPEHP